MIFAEHNSATKWLLFERKEYNVFFTKQMNALILSSTHDKGEFYCSTQILMENLTIVPLYDLHKEQQYVLTSYLCKIAAFNIKHGLRLLSSDIILEEYISFCILK